MVCYSGLESWLTFSTAQNRREKEGGMKEQRRRKIKRQKKRTERKTFDSRHVFMELDKQQEKEEKKE